MTGLARRWAAIAVVCACSAGASFPQGFGATAVGAGDDPPDAASAQALLAAVRGVSEPVCQLLAVALRNSYSVGAGSRALGYAAEGTPAGGGVAFAGAAALTALAVWVPLRMGARSLERREL